MTSNVLYIAGMGRSGSTLLARALGAVEGVVNLGEATAYWTHATMRARRIRCGCGREVHQCPFWVAWTTSPPFDDDLERRLSLRRSLTPGWHRVVASLGADLASFYQRLHEATGAELLVDASKHAALAHAVVRASAVDAQVVHLVRDPRGVASSRSRAKSYLESFSPGYVALRWDVVNVVVQRLAGSPSYHLVHYEDFVADPSTVLASLLARTTVAGASLPMEGDRTIVTAPDHALAGNPDKFGGERLEIQPARTPPASTAVTALSGPLMRRYGYS